MRRVVLLGLAAFLLLSTAEAGAGPNEWMREVPKKLKETKVNLEFVDTPLEEALNFLAQFTGVSIALDPEVLRGKPEGANVVTLKTTALEAGSALSLLTRLANLSYDVRWGGVFVSTKARLFALPENARQYFLDYRQDEVKGMLAKLRKPVSFSFEGTPLPDVTNYLSTISKVNIIILPEVYESVGEVEVTLNVSDLSVENALCQVLLPRGLTYRLKSGVVMVTPLPEDPAAHWKVEAEKILEEKKTSVDFDDTPVEEALAELCQPFGIGVYLDPAVKAEKSEEELFVTLRADNISVANALELIALVKGLAMELRWGGILISLPERLKKLPRTVLPAADASSMEPWELSLRKSLRGTISFSFDSTSISEVLNFFRALKGVNIVLEPKAQEAADSVMCTAAASDITLEQALSLVLVPRGFTYKLQHEVLLITRK